MRTIEIVEDEIAILVTKIECTQEEIRDCKNEIVEKEKEMNNIELDESEYEEQYQESLDSEGTVTVCGYEFVPSRILRELDPIAYNCGLSDFCYSIDVETTEEYITLENEKEELKSELEDFEVRLEEENEELETLEEELIDLVESEKEDE